MEFLVVEIFATCAVAVAHFAVVVRDQLLRP